MTDSDRNHNLLQFRLMQRLLEQYQAGAIKLRQLIDDLEALNAALRNPTEDWLSEFEPAWGALEDVYAAMLAEGRTSLNEDVDKPLIKRSVSRLLSNISLKWLRNNISPGFSMRGLSR